MLFRETDEIQKCATVMPSFTLNQSDPCAGTESVDEDVSCLFGPVEDPLWKLAYVSMATLVSRGAEQLKVCQVKLECWAACQPD